MSSTEFCTKLVQKWPDFAKVDAAKEELQDIRKFLDRLDPSSIDDVWAEFRETYGYNTYPKLPAIVKGAEKAGAEKRTPKSRWTYDLVCYKCSAAKGQTIRYGLNEMECPNCHNSDRALFAVIRSGISIDIEAIQEYVANYHEGPHPVFGREKRPSGSPVRAEEALRRMIAKQASEGRAIANTGRSR